MAGAILNLLLGTISYDAIKEVVDLTWNATVAFVSLIMLCIALKEIGLFDWAASHMIHLSKGSCSKLFVYLVLLGALVSAIFANDGAALILTPIILAKVRMLNIGKANIIPFAIAGGFIADSASIPLITSNLVNIIAGDYFGLGYAEYALRMFVPYLVSVAVSLGLLYWMFHKQFPHDCDCNVVKKAETK